MMSMKELESDTDKTSFSRLSQGSLRITVQISSLTILMAPFATKITLNQVAPCNKMKTMTNHRKNNCQPPIFFNVGFRLPMYPLLANNCEESTRSCFRENQEKISNHLLLPHKMSLQLPVSSTLNQLHPAYLECQSTHQTQQMEIWKCKELTNGCRNILNRLCGTRNLIVWCPMNNTALELKLDSTQSMEGQISNGLLSLNTMLSTLYTIDTQHPGYVPLEML